MKKLLLTILLLTLPACGESLESMKARRTELRERVALLRVEVNMLDTLLSPGTDVHPQLQDQYMQLRDSYRKVFTEEELKDGYYAMRDRRVEELAELEPKLEEIEAKVDREIRR